MICFKCRGGAGVQSYKKKLGRLARKMVMTFVGDIYIYISHSLEVVETTTH